MQNQMNLSGKTRLMALAGLMIAICAILTFTPLGMIPTPVVSATICHIPVIIASVVCGPIVGVIVGVAFGLLSLIRAWTAPNGILDYYARNPLVSVLPRILIGLSAYYFYVAGARLKRFSGIFLGLATIFGLIFIFYLIQASDWAQDIELFKSEFMPSIISMFVGISAIAMFAIGARYKNSAGYVLGAAMGSITNTFGFLGMIYLIYRNDLFVNHYDDLGVTGTNASDVVSKVFLGIVGTAGLAEMIIAAVVCSAVIMSLKKFMRGFGD